MSAKSSELRTAAWGTCQEEAEEEEPMEEKEEWLEMEGNRRANCGSKGAKGAAKGIGLKVL